MADDIMDNNDFDFNVDNAPKTPQNDQITNLTNSIDNRSSNASNQDNKPTSSVINVPMSNKEDGLNQKINLETEKPEVTKSTLDEPVAMTLKRDLYNILNKIKFVAFPRVTEKKLEELYDWDLWGPLLFCFLYSIALSTGENKNNENSIFVLIFVIFWVGGLVLTFNGRFLGAEIGLCQMISLLGYGMFPITLGGFIIGFGKIKSIAGKFVIMSICFIWSTIVSIGFVKGLVAKGKQFLVVFPVIIFLLSISLFALNY
jgi:hypothetical protein